jgi:hypothetical protein
MKSSAFPHDKTYDYDADHVNGEIFNTTDDLSKFRGSRGDEALTPPPLTTPPTITYIGMTTPTATHPDRL